MPTVQEAIKRLRYEFTSTGAEKVAADANKVGDAVTKSTTQQERAALSLEKQFAGLERRYNTTIRAQQDYEKVVRQVNAAVAQNPALQGRANEVLRLAAVHYQQASSSQRLFSGALQAANDNAQTFAARGGALVSVLTRLGPAGLVTGGIIVGVAVALHQAAQAALALGDKAGKLVDFAETTRLSTDALQALQKAGSQVGLSFDQIATNIEKFSANFSQARRRTGEFYEQLLEVNPALARQISEARSVADAFDLYNRAIAQANELDRIRLSRAAFGRGGAGMVRLANYAQERGGLQGLIADMDRADIRSREFLQTLDEIADKTKYSWDKAKENFVALFAQPMVSALEWITGKALEFSRLPSRMMAQQPSAPLQIVVRPGNPAAAPPPPTDEDLKTKIISEYNEMQRWMSVMGSAATLAQQFELRQRQIAAALAEGKIGVVEYRQAMGVAELEHIINVEGRRLGLLGDLASVEAIVAQKQREVNLAVKQGSLNYLEAAAIVSRTRVQAEAAKPENQVRMQREAVFLSESEARIRQQILAWGIDYNSVRGQALAQELRIIDVLKQATDLLNSSMNTLLKGIIEGKRGFELWKPVLSGISNSLLDIGTKSLSKSLVSGLTGKGFNFDPVSIGMGALGFTLGMILEGFGDSAKQAKEAEEALARARQRAAEYTERAAMAAIDQSTAAGQIAALDLQAQRERLDEMRQGHGAIVELERALAAERIALLKKIRDESLKLLDADIEQSSVQTRLADIARARDDLLAAIARGSQAVQEVLITGKGGRALRELQIDVETLGLTAAEVARRVAEATVRLRAGFIGDLQRQLNDATGRGFINDLTDLMAQVVQMRADAARLGTNQDTLIDRILGARAQQVIDDAGLVGDAFNEITRLFPSLTGLIHQSTAALEEAAQAERERLDAINQTARSITDYLSGLQTGAESPLSPSARLTAAQTTYNQQYALAIGGNVDAQRAFPQYAEALRQAAQAMFASGSGYQAIFNQIVSQGLALPAVQAATDPVVIALRDAITAIQATTTAVNVNTSSVDTGNTLATQQKNILDLIKAANDTSNALVSAQNSLITTGNALTTTANAIHTSTNALITSSNAILTQLQALNTTSLQQLDLLNAQLSSGTISPPPGVTRTSSGGGQITTPGLLAFGGDPGATINNTMLVALNKIVLNTWATATNTGQHLNLARGVSFGAPRFGVFADGGLAPANTRAIYGEHHPQGPFTMNVDRPTYFSPGFPSNDNGGVVAELRALREQNHRMALQINNLLSVIADIGRANVVATQENTAQLGEQSERSRQNDRMTARQKVAVAS